jgi:hypothetical protein
VKKVLIAALVVFAMGFGTMAHAATAQKFVATQAEYPIYVNGVEYRDASLPPLNYEGKTYIPLSKIGDILGVEYKWNAELKRVEIGGLKKDAGAAVMVPGNACGGPQGKPYTLTNAEYPIFVNGVEYKDKKYPPLNFNGKTYIPLSKIGDILGVKYRWNAEKKRVEIGAPVDDSKLPAGNADEDCLYVTDAKGKYAGYYMLHGYPEQDKFQIYFKVTSNGSYEQYHITYEDLRGLNLNERITWKYDGNTYTHTRSQLNGFFADTRWFRNNLSGVGDYTLTHEWFVDTFGDVYLDWAEGYYFDAEAYVTRYMDQLRQPPQYVPILTPDAEVEIIDEQPEEPTADEVIRGIEELMNNRLSEEEKQFRATWIGAGELERDYGITVSQLPDRNEIRFMKYKGFPEGYEILHTIRDVPNSLEPDVLLTGDGVRYMYSGGLYFHREDLANLGVIPQSP